MKPDRERSLIARFGWGSGAIFGLWLVVVTLSNIARRPPSDAPRHANKGSAIAADSLYVIASEYAPFIYHATDRSGGRQDLISNIDFDGDLIANNNWENLDRFELRPTVYYSALETATHYFLSYHLFHPRDWNHFTIWMNDTHENDGENLQIVVRKVDRRIVLLLTQAHYDSNVYTRSHSGIESGSIQIAGEFQDVDSNGDPVEDGRHAAVFVESEGHGIYGALDRNSEVKLAIDGSFSFKGRGGVLFRPARSGELVAEPETVTSGQYPYQLDSVNKKLWPLLRDGMLAGDGRLLDGSVTYFDDLVGTLEVPRYYDANRVSGPLGKDRGISPFALDFSFDRGSLGALFFNPARRYKEGLKVRGEWSMEYVNYPFTDRRGVEDQRTRALIDTRD